MKLGAMQIKPNLYIPMLQFPYEMRSAFFENDTDSALQCSMRFIHKIFMIESPLKSLFHCKQTNIHMDIQCIKRQTFDNHECLLNVRRTGVGWMRLLGGILLR